MANEKNRIKLKYIVFAMVPMVLFPVLLLVSLKLAGNEKGYRYLKLRNFSSLSNGNLPEFKQGKMGKQSKVEVMQKARIPRIPFITNKGQMDERIMFYANTFGGTIFVTQEGEIIYSLHKVETKNLEGISSELWEEQRSGSNSLEAESKRQERSKVAVLKEEIEGGRIKFEIKGEGKAVTQVSYFNGKDSSKWKTGISTYETITFGEIYPGIELKLKTHGDNVEKLFYVKPNADPQTIKLKLSGFSANDLHVNEKDELEAETALGTVKFTKPVAYQEIDGKRVEVAVNYQISECGMPPLNPLSIGDKSEIQNQKLEYGFKIASYDKTRELVIDPLLASMYLGGSHADDAMSMAIDAAGNVYVVGHTWSSDFPTTTSVYDMSFGGSSDIFVSKLNSSLTNIISSTYLGGDNQDIARSIAVDADGNVYVAGKTSSTDFPTTSGAYDTSRGGSSDIFISKLNGDLTKLLASTFLGGTYNENCFSMIVDSNKNIYVTGETLSTDFPTTTGAYDVSKSGYSDAFISKLNTDLTRLLASTYLGGTEQDRVFSIVVDSRESVYVTGTTLSKDFPTTIGAYDTSYNSDVCDDVFVSKLNGNLTTLLASTYLGGDSYESGYSIVLNPVGNVYVSGITYSSDFPTTFGAYHTSKCSSESDAFISKLSGDLTSLLSSTYLGGTREDEVDFATIDLSGNIYVAGVTKSSKDFPTTPGAYNTSYNGGDYDGFISKIRGDLTSLFASTYLGGSGTDYPRFLFIDSDGNIYVVGATTSTDLPTSTGAYDTSYDDNAFVSKLDGDLSDSFTTPTTPSPSQSPTPTDSTIVTIRASSDKIFMGQLVEITGTITLTPDNETTQKRFLEETLRLTRIDPDSEYMDIIETQPFLYEDKIYYTFKCVSLPAIGTWELLVGFDAYEDMKGAISDSIEVNVYNTTKEIAGYAILVEGRAEGESGINSHNLTTNYIYKKLLERGFVKENIYYYNFDTTQDGVDKKPTKDDVLNAIKVLASEKMNKLPAPLYIIFVGHGKKEEFLIYPDAISSGELSDTLNELESKLSKNAKAEPMIVILGANYTGSFINNLSKSGSKRIIITSSDTEEVAYKGPLPPNEMVRHGDYFVYEFFKYAARGTNLMKCYEMATDKIAVFTENKEGNGLKGASAGNGQYFDKSAQHPLLDDNGDGAGTYEEVSSLSDSDGELTSEIILGIGTSTTSLKLTRVTDIITLMADDARPTLYAKVNDTARADKVWIEIVPPNQTLKNKDTNNLNSTEQQVINLPRFGYNEFDKTMERYIWNDFKGNNEFDNFKEAGEYKIFYFAQEKDVGEITPFKESEVFVNAIGNKPPTSFSTIFPSDGMETAVALTFDWEDSTDPDSETTTYHENKNGLTKSKNEGVAYILMISQSSDFDTIDYQLKGLVSSVVMVDKTANLHDGATYYWKVLASDPEGGVTTGTTTSFKPKLANGYPGFVKGYVYDNDTNAKVVGATITKQGLKGSATTAESGAYILQLPSGSYTLTVEASGYDTETSTVSVSALGVTTENIGLVTATQPASIFGKVKDKKGNLLQGVTITAKMKTVTKTVTTGNDGSYSIADLEAGKYKLTADKKGYKGYKQSITLKTGQDMTLNIQLNKKK